MPKPALTEGANKIATKKKNFIGRNQHCGKLAPPAIATTVAAVDPEPQQRIQLTTAAKPFVRSEFDVGSGDADFDNDVNVFGLTVPWAR